MMMMNEVQKYQIPSRQNCSSGHLSEQQLIVVNARRSSQSQQRISRQVLMPAQRAVASDRTLALRLDPLVQSQVSHQGWAFIWELDRPCENLAWLLGSDILVEDRLYRVNGIERMPENPRIGDRLTLLCSSLS